MRASTHERWGDYLVELAWELDMLGFDFTIRFPPGGRPSLEVFAPPGQPQVRTARRGRTSTFTWTVNRYRSRRTESRKAVGRAGEVGR